MSAKLKGLNAGSKHGNAVLNERDVWEIKHLLEYTSYFQREIGEWYGVTQQCITNINRGIVWCHVNVGDDPAMWESAT